MSEIEDGTVSANHQTLSADTVPSRNQGELPGRPTLNFDPIGEVSRAVGDGVAWFGSESTSLFICGRCGAVVGQGWIQHHVDWHAAYSAEVWPDGFGQVAP